MTITVVRLRRYPIKSLGGHDLRQAEVEIQGLADDRRWLLVNAVGCFQTQRQIHGLAQLAVSLTSEGLEISHPHHGTIHVSTPKAGAPVIAVRVWDDMVPARLASSEAERYLSDFTGQPLRLVHMNDIQVRPVDPRFGHAQDRVSFADGFPLLLTSTGSLADLNRRVGGDLDMRRFRPNLVVSDPEPWAEDSWRRIRVGAVSFRVVKPCSRCIITTLDPDTGTANNRGEPLETLGAFRRDARGRICFGQNLIPDAPGTIALGDSVVVLERGPSNLTQTSIVELDTPPVSGKPSP